MKSVVRKNYQILMPNCPKCKHEDWCHHRVSGKCESYEWINVTGPFPLDDLPGLAGMKYEIDYGPECKCENPDLFKTTR